MRIPLDYYRILGLPIQATAEQLQQAYSDRALQLPRREYSEAAITARKHLLDEAYAVLSNPEHRSSYDTSFLAETYAQDADPGVDINPAETTRSADVDADPFSPTLTIPPEKFVGALLILHELGEYELVLKLSRPYLSSGNLSISLDKGLLGDPQLVRPDIILTITLACLELGREQWQQSQYENAASSLETGQKLLLSEGLFPSVRGEIQADLYKLRPYRILELLALADSNVAERQQGLRLLQDMLQERSGIDGTGDDQSGLSIDDFLRFIQQLRGYLSSAEQQALFEAEAKRPSAVATYLAVYALLGRGFAERQPALIARSKQLLMRLGRRQDVHLEQAVCALLLGQTEEASRALELSQEYEPLAFIRERSQGSPDLLPGLCLYAERWLQTEVFPHFRDLAQQRVSLKDYFADQQVQNYLEDLPTEADTQNDWAVVESQRVSYPPGTANSRVSSEPSMPPSSEGEAVTNSRNRSSRRPAVHESAINVGQDSVATTRSSSVMATLTPTLERLAGLGVSTLASSQQISTPIEAEPNGTSFLGESSTTNQRRQERSHEHASTPLVNRLRGSESISQPLPNVGDSPAHHPNGVQRTPTKKSSTKIGRLILLGVGGLVGLAILLWLIGGALSLLNKTFQGFSAPALEGEQPLVQLDQPPIPIPAPDTQQSAPVGPLTEETAKEVIQTWLSSKAKALGEDHQVEPLKQVLVDPALSRWQKRANSANKNKSYWEYKHSVAATSVKTSDKNPDEAIAEAAVKEVAKLYKEGRLNKSSSYDSNLRVQYDMVRKDNQWRIQDMKVLK